jgi:hypothetical protein
MAHLCLMIGTYGSNSALFMQLYTSLGYRLHGTVDYHALSNKKAGYGEPKQVVDINEHILAHNASRWYDLRCISQLSTWSTDDDIRQQLTAYVDGISSNAIVNDPRLSYTLPLWQSVFTQAGHDLTIVVPYQHPLIHAHAMHHQHHMSTRLALALWVAYTLAIEVHSRSFARVFVAHDAIMRDWQQACQPITTPLAPDGLTTTITTQIDAYIHMIKQTTPAEPQISPRIRELAIAQLAHDVYAAIQQPNIDPVVMAALQQRFDVEIADPQYRHDVGQYEVIFNDIFLDTEARIRALNAHHTNAMHRQHSEFSTKIRLLHEEHSTKMTTLYEKHGRYIEHQSLMFAETLTKHEQQITHMRATFEQEIQHLTDKIATMQTEIDWRTNVTTQQQHTLEKLSWAIRIVAFGERISRIIRKS